MITPIETTLLPAAMAVSGAGLALRYQPSLWVERGVQHLAAGVVFAAAAVEILPLVQHQASLWATTIGGALGVVVMLLLRSLEKRLDQGPVGFLAITAMDLLVDGLVLGLAFVAGQRAGALLTLALTMEVLFLGVAVATEVMGFYRSALRVMVAVIILAAMLPLGAALGLQVSHLPRPIVAGFLTFGLVSLLYLVTEELLVEAHQGEEGPYTTALFFIGFLVLLLIEEAV